jgi:hypothetical protein
MYKEISIPIELDSEEFCDILKSNISDNLDAELESALVDGMWEHNDRAAYEDDSLRIVEIEHIKENEYVMHYEYDWFAYLGCKDMNHGDVGERSVHFKLESGRIIFSCLILEPPAPDEEF